VGGGGRRGSMTRYLRLSRLQARGLGAGARRMRPCGTRRPRKAVYANLEGRAVARRSASSPDAARYTSKNRRRAVGPQPPLDDRPLPEIPRQCSVGPGNRWSSTVADPRPSSGLPRSFMADPFVREHPAVDHHPPVSQGHAPRRQAGDSRPSSNAAFVAGAISVSAAADSARVRHPKIAANRRPQYRPQVPDQVGVECRQGQGAGRTRRG